MRYLLLALGSYIFFIIFLYAFQRHIQYQPYGKLESFSNYNLTDFQEIKLKTSDNLEIISWYKKPLSGQKTIIYFHGNGGNLSNRVHRYKSLGEAGFGVLAVSYRGYSGNPGYPTQKGLMLDAKASYKFLLKQGLKDSDIILYGESLGSGVSANLAKDHNFYAIIFESPFSSAASVAANRFPFVPARLLLKDKFESDKALQNLNTPILIIHGTKDKVVSFSEGKKLYDSISSKRKKFIKVPGARHLDFSDEFLVTKIKIFLSEI